MANEKFKERLVTIKTNEFSYDGKSVGITSNFAQRMFKLYIDGEELTLPIESVRIEIGPTEMPKISVTFIDI